MKEDNVLNCTEFFKIQKCVIQTNETAIEVAYFDTDSKGENKCFLYLFPGSGANEEWECESKGDILFLLKTILSKVKRHPPMRVVMPYIYLNNGEDPIAKIKDAQKVTHYIKDIVNYFEGTNSWDTKDGYKRRAVAGVCLGALSALKLALYWEQIENKKKEKFYSLGMFSPANDAGAGNWIGKEGGFKFADGRHHSVYIACGSMDDKNVHAKRYAYNFIKNDLTLTITLKSFIGGGHDWTCFKKGFEDFMSENIYFDDYYKNI